ncbi:zinc-binding dehydrogenase [Pseudonocardia sp. NPDC046786]|uniref:zinc-dependent alcohol dehydrogenase n=1 Tax=Pseudonocardia sp. NPDC046786 TaxID=3155471 RepID=UPI00340F7347
MQGVMRAMRLKTVGVDPSLTEIPVPEPGEGEVRIAMRACGICGSDLHVVDGSTVVDRLPVTMGHEPSGVVDALGAGVDSLSCGQRVVVNGLVPCGTCGQCTRGRRNRCEQLCILGLGRDGAHADYFTVPAESVIPLPDGIGFELGAIITDAIATPMHAIRKSGVQKGQTAAVFGLGGLGIHAAMILRQLYEVEVVGIDVDDAALANARRAGVADVVDAREAQVARRIRDETGGGVDVAFEFVGSAAVVEQGLRSLRPGGTCVVAGVHPNRLQLGLRQETLVARELTLTGSLGYTNEDISDLLHLVNTGELVFDDTVSHVFDLADYQTGLDTLRQPDSASIRVVITADA